MTFFQEYIWSIVLGLTILLVFYQIFKKPKIVDVKPPLRDEPRMDVVPWTQVSELIEQERHRIASDMHDELGSLLSVIHLDLELVLREASALTPHGEARLMEIRKNLSHATAAIRHNIWSLSPQMLDQVDLAFALRELCHKLDAYKGTHLRFAETGMVRPLSQKQKLNLFRIVQELLTNAIKHSGAWNISVNLDWQPEKLIIVVEDDGSGYQRLEHEQQSGGMGTGNITRRANSIGVTMQRAELSRGLRVTLELPNG
jgi:signal transduction histidine kinase